MVTRNFYQILDSFPSELWKDLPTWYGAYLFRTHISNRYTVPGPGTFDSFSREKHLKNNYKTQEAFDYVKSRLKEFHVLAMSTEDSLVFEPQRLPQKTIHGKIYSQIDSITVSIRNNRIKEKSVNLPGKSTWAPSSDGRLWEFLSSKTWDMVRRNKIEAYRESLLSEEDKFIRVVANTKNVLTIASKLSSLEAQIESIREKIDGDSLTKTDTRVFNQNIKSMLKEITKSSKSLPK